MREVCHLAHAWKAPQRDTPDAAKLGRVSPPSSDDMAKEGGAANRHSNAVLFFGLTKKVQQSPSNSQHTIVGFGSDQ
jgi:hypothetical protein